MSEKIHSRRQWGKRRQKAKNGSMLRGGWLRKAK